MDSSKKVRKKMSSKMNNNSSLPKHMRKNNDKENLSPRPKTGFVKDMCRFYSKSPSAARQLKNAANSTNSPLKNNRRRPIPIVLNNNEEQNSIENENFSEEMAEPSGQILNQNLHHRLRSETSPTWQSIRSQDSGFSDAECEGVAAGAGADNSPDFNVYQV